MQEFLLQPSLCSSSSGANSVSPTTFVPERHQDPGLQPERTTLAWGRTMLSLVAVSATFLRWLPHRGLPVILLFGISTATATAIYLTQRRRYRISANAIRQERADASTLAILWTAVSGLVLSGMGTLLVLSD